MLTTEEALDRISQIVGCRCEPECLRSATHLEWLRRILGNLQQTFQRTDRLADLQAMNELAALLPKP